MSKNGGVPSANAISLVAIRDAYSRGVRDALDAIEAGLRVYEHGNLGPLTVGHVRRLLDSVRRTTV